MKMKKTKKFQDFLLGRKSGSVLKRVKGLKLEDGHRGCLAVCGLPASVELEQGGWIRITRKVTGKPGRRTGERPQAALEANATLPGNVRFAMGHGVTLLVADTQVDGETHLVETLDEIRYGMAVALGRKRWRADRVAIEAERIEASIAELELGNGAVVKRDDGWELRLRLRGTTHPVRAMLDGNALRLHRRLAKSVPDDARATVVAAQALRFNGRLRLCRLAMVDGTLCVETKLGGHVVSPHWIHEAVRAVAVASGLCTEALKILAEDERVARCYARMFSLGANKGLNGNERG